MSDRAQTGTGRSRRAVLAGLGTGVVASVAGCTTLPAFGQRVRYGDVDEPSAGTAVYRDWIPAEMDASDPPGAVSVQFQRPGKRGEQTLGGAYGDDRIKAKMEYVGVDFRDFDWALLVGNTVVGRTPFDHDRVRATLERTDYEPAGKYRGFDLYRRETPPVHGKTVAVGEELLLLSTGGRAAIEEIADTGSGRRPRRHERSTGFARLAQELGGMPVTTVSGSGDVEGGTGTVAYGLGVAVEDSAAYVSRVRIHAADADVSRNEVEAAIEESPRALDANRVDIRLDGPVETVVAELDHGTFEELLGPLYDYPLVSWRAAYDPGAERLSITHQAGEAVDASVLTLLDTMGVGEEPADVQFADEYGTVEPGDELTVDVDGRDEWHYLLQGTVPGTDETWTEFNVGEAWFE